MRPMKPGQVFPNNHNLQPFGGKVHNLARKPSKEEVQAMLSQQLEVLAREIYCRVASKLTAVDDAEFVERCRDYAKLARMAAKAYFEAMGVRFEEEPAPVEPTTIATNPAS